MLKLILTYFISRSIVKLFGLGIFIFLGFYLYQQFQNNGLAGVAIPDYIQSSLKSGVATIKIYGLNMPLGLGDGVDNSATDIINRNSPPSITMMDATVVKVIDGDTLKVVIQGQSKPVSVRLLEIDTFEVFPSSSMDNDAKQFHMGKKKLKQLGMIGSLMVKQLLQKGSHIRLSFKNGSAISTGKYGRTLAFIHLDDNTILNEILVYSGGALAYPSNTSKHQWYLNLESNARNHHRGIWAVRNVRTYAIHH